MSPLGVIALIIALMLGVFVIWTLNEPAVRRTVTLVEKARFAGGLLFLALAAYHLIRSGNIVYQFLAAVGFAFLTGYLLVEKPWQKTI